MEKRKKDFVPDENFFRSLVDGLNSEIFVCDAEGYVVYLNPASEYLTGRKLRNVLGRHITELEEDGTITQNNTMEVIKTGKIITSIQGVKNSRHLLAISTPIYNEDNELAYVVTSAQDIGELSQINKRLIDTNNELIREMEAMNIYKNEFFSDEGLIFVGDAMESMVHTVSRIASLDVIVLILGETGVGKEGIAKMIHRMGKSKKSPFVKINCGMIPEPLFESELFGYEEGSFTGALKGGKIGKIELANNGTLFLDEIGELPLSVQVKLLEFLQEKTIVRVGGTTRIPVNTRIVAATHRNLKEMCEKGQFRQDLYYRLNVVPLEIPPLRNRMDEIIHIAQFMLYKCNKKYNLDKTFDKDILEALKDYDWPGNLRELEHVIERLYVTADTRVLTATALKEILGKGEESRSAKVICTEIMPLKEAKGQVEKELVLRACKEGGSTYKAAKLLNIDQSTVVKILKRHGLQ
ncbi:MAG: sigma 54-interacting transcriptional regulator [Bacillota bacterium]|nr:sigma 54-interacting transcriptional regulator [Bacillota bacterium]